MESLTAAAETNAAEPVPANGTGPVTSAALGPRIRSLRGSLELSLRDLAGRTGVSAGTLSQVERGETSPTLAVAERIAAGLDLSLSQLLRLDEASHMVVVRSGEGRRRVRHGHIVEELTPPLPGQRADVSVHDFEPGATTGGSEDPPIHEPGSRETLVVLDGSIELHLDGGTTRLETGDSVTYDADLAHHIENPGNDPARLLAVIAAGLRRG